MRILYAPNQYSQQRQFEKPSNIYPVLMAMEAQWYRENYAFVENEVYWLACQGIPDKIITKPEGLPFLTLPEPDRTFSRAKSYTSGNYKYLPGTHILSASGCWHGECSFCIENGKSYEIRDIYKVCSEIYNCKSLGFKEIFDDSATFPIGDWLLKFCKEKYNYFKDYPFSCNMRMADIDFRLLKNCGFRMLLFGLESANQQTLDKIGKGTKVEDVKYIIKAAEAGLDCHVAVMFGYPWETEKDALNTLKLVHTLLRKGIAKTAQASFFTMDGRQSNTSHRRFVKSIYSICCSPEFWFNQIRDIKDASDLKYLWRKIKTGLKEWK